MASKKTTYTPTLDKDINRLAEAYLIRQQWRANAYLENNKIKNNKNKNQDELLNS